MSDPEGRPATTTVAIADFAALCEVSETIIRDLIRRGALPKASAGRLPLIEAVRVVIRHVRSEARDATLSAAQESARAARAEAAELALAVEQRTLVPDEDAQAAVDHVAGAVVRAATGMAARITRDPNHRRRIDAALLAAQTAIADDLDRQAGLGKGRG